jgi:hypothetical protein
MLLGTIHHGHGTRRNQASKERNPTLSIETNSSCATPNRQNPSPLPHKKNATKYPSRPKSIIDPAPSRRLLVQNSNCCLLSTSNQFFFFSILRLPRRPDPPPGKNSPPISLCNNVYVLVTKDYNKNRIPKTPTRTRSGCNPISKKPW